MKTILTIVLFLALLVSLFTGCTTEHTVVATSPSAPLAYGADSALDANKPVTAKQFTSAIREVTGEPTPADKAKVDTIVAAPAPEPEEVAKLKAKADSDNLKALETQRKLSIEITDLASALHLFDSQWGWYAVRHGIYIFARNSVWVFTGIAGTILLLRLLCLIPALSFVIPISSFFGKAIIWLLDIAYDVINWIVKMLFKSVPASVTAVENEIKNIVSPAPSPAAPTPAPVQAASTQPIIFK